MPRPCISRPSRRWAGRLTDGSGPRSLPGKVRVTRSAPRAGRDDAGPGGSLCGLSYLPDPPSARTADRAYSVVNIACAVPNHSYVHEAGHNMGLRHDRYVERAFGRLQSKYN